jgi:hypothetical protein
MTTGECLLRAHGDGCLELVRADDEIEVADEFLAQLAPGDIRDGDGKTVGFSLGDGILTVHATNGTVSYGLHSHDDLRMTWRGTRGR